MPFNNHVSPHDPGRPDTGSDTPDTTGSSGTPSRSWRLGRYLGKRLAKINDARLKRVRHRAAMTRIVLDPWGKNANGKTPSSMQDVYTEFERQMADRQTRASLLLLAIFAIIVMVFVLELVVVLEIL